MEVLDYLDLKIKTFSLTYLNLRIARVDLQTEFTKNLTI